MRERKHNVAPGNRASIRRLCASAGIEAKVRTLLVRPAPLCGSKCESANPRTGQKSAGKSESRESGVEAKKTTRSQSAAVRSPAQLQSSERRDGRQVRSDGSVFFAGVRISGDNCAKIHDEAAVIIPTHRKVA